MKLIRRSKLTQATVAAICLLAFRSEAIEWDSEDNGNIQTVIDQVSNVNKTINGNKPVLNELKGQLQKWEGLTGLLAEGIDDILIWIEPQLDEYLDFGVSI